ncbi:MAG TPA: AI-2E family transporter [Burkholderiales bacterium]|nr:AI-2E family transporter [Burkholderiales bacterium]
MAKPPDSTPYRVLQDRPFLVLLVAITAAFAWILWPFYGVIFWATVLAILFAPLHRRLTKRMGQRHNLAALATTAVIVLIVILPAGIVTGLLIQEGIGVYVRIQSGELDFARYFQQVLGALPGWASGLLDRFGIGSLADVQARLSAGLSKGVQFLAGQAMNVGQNAAEFVVNFFIMLYLLFFFLRDGGALSLRMKHALPLDEDLQQNLATKFATVIRATIKGNIVVAIIQGALGGLIFWLLEVRAPVFWAVIMMFLSLLPAVGTALVWGPVAIYLLVTGAIWQGIVLIAYGVLVIGLVDNVLRPILVGKDTKMPDWVVLISTLGGMVIFGFNGFVIGPVIAAMFIAVWAVVGNSRAKA